MGNSRTVCQQKYAYTIIMPESAARSRSSFYARSNKLKKSAVIRKLFTEDRRESMRECGGSLSRDRQGPSRSRLENSIEFPDDLTPSCAIPGHRWSAAANHHPQPLSREGRGGKSASIGTDCC
jgi:hypothetical protein